MIANVTLAGLEMGSGTDYPIDEPGIGGLGTPSAKTADSSFDGQDGSSAAPDFLDVRVITIPLVLLGADTEAAMGLLDELNGTWDAIRDGVDVELEIALPGWTRTYVGRPRGVDADLVEVGQGIILALCRFEAMEPIGVPGS